jgi:hypothetical protein
MPFGRGGDQDDVADQIGDLHRAGSVWQFFQEVGRDHVPIPSVRYDALHLATSRSQNHAER